MKTHVDKDDVRPARNDGTCFYCRQEIGQPHEWECPIPEKTVRVRAVILYDLEVPRSWDKENVEFFLNDSSSCADNQLGRMREYTESHGCLCNSAKFSVVSMGDKQ